MDQTYITPDRPIPLIGTFIVILKMTSAWVVEKSVTISYLRNILNTRNSVSSGYPNTEKRVKYDAQRSIYDEIRGVWIADETLSRVFDISSQSKRKLRRKRSRIVKIYAN